MEIINEKNLEKDKGFDQHPFVSVVTPVYNTEKYLAECIESILGQTYNNFEYVIVDNCSTDNSLNIAQHYANSDHRIRICNNKVKLGMFQNWNHALRQISSDSKYCKVVHADDWLFKDCIAKMVNIAETDPEISMVGSYRLEETKVTCDGLSYPSTVVSGREVCRSTLRGEFYVFGSPTTLLIRSDFIRARKSFYNEDNFHCDTEICNEILRDTNFGFVHEILSFTRRHNEANTAFAKRINTFIAGQLLVLKKYGPIYLSDKECQKAIQIYLKKYYNLLAKHVFKLKEKEFWQFHKNELKNLGYPVDYLRLCKYLFIVLYNKVLEKMRI